MTDQAARFAALRALHVPGDPVVLYNIWDVGSARAVAAAGAKALATGSHPVADAMGFADGEQVPLDLALANAQRIAASVDLPLSVDFEGGYSTDRAVVEANAARLAATGAVGCNFEDQVIGGEGLHLIADQVRRLAAFRRGAGDAFFLNARTDLFLKHAPETHDDAMLDEAIARGKAFADAGASGMFVPRLSDPRLMARLIAAVPLPINAIAFPGGPTRAQWAQMGVARISHGPFPHRALMKQLTEAAAAAMA